MAPFPMPSRLTSEDLPPLFTHTEKANKRLKEKCSIFPQSWAIFMAFAVDGASTPNIVNSSLARTREYLTGNDVEKRTLQPRAIEKRTLQSRAASTARSGLCAGRFSALPVALSRLERRKGTARGDRVVKSAIASYAVNTVRPTTRPARRSLSAECASPSGRLRVGIGAIFLARARSRSSCASVSAPNPG